MSDRKLIEFTIVRFEGSTDGLRFDEIEGETPFGPELSEAEGLIAEGRWQVDRMRTGMGDRAKRFADLRKPPTAAVPEPGDERSIVVSLRGFKEYLDRTREHQQQAQRRLKEGTPSQREFARGLLSSTDEILGNPLVAVKRYDDFLRAALEAIMGDDGSEEGN